jgi:hypothetical protein
MRPCGLAKGHHFIRAFPQVLVMAIRPAYGKITGADPFITPTADKFG